MTLEREGISSDRSFWHRKVDRHLLLFHGWRAILFEGFANALLASKVRSPFTTFSLATGDRSFSIESSIAFYYFFAGDGRSLFLASCRSIALYYFFTREGRSLFLV